MGISKEGRSAAAASVAAPPKLYRPGEVIEFARISRQMLHTYALLGLVTEERSTRAGHRLYAESIFARLARIDRLKREGKTLREIREILEREAG